MASALWRSRSGSSQASAGSMAPLKLSPTWLACTQLSIHYELAVCQATGDKMLVRRSSASARQSAAIRIQASARRVVATRSLHTRQYHEFCVTRIQASARRVAAKYAMQEKRLKHESALRLQTAMVRPHLARRRSEHRMIRKRHSTMMKQLLTSSRARMQAVGFALLNAQLKRIEQLGVGHAVLEHEELKHALTDVLEWYWLDSKAACVQQALRALARVAQLEATTALATFFLGLDLSPHVHRQLIGRRMTTAVPELSGDEASRALARAFQAVESAQWAEAAEQFHHASELTPSDEDPEGRRALDLWFALSLASMAGGWDATEAKAALLRYGDGVLSGELAEWHVVFLVALARLAAQQPNDAAASSSAACFALSTQLGGSSWLTDEERVLARHDENERMHAILQSLDASISGAEVVIDASAATMGSAASPLPPSPRRGRAIEVQPTSPVARWAEIKACGVPATIEAAMEPLMNYAGQRELKELALSLCQRVLAESQLSSEQRVKTSLHFIFCGSSGTGKKLAARLFAKLLYELGLRRDSYAAGSGLDADEVLCAHQQAKGGVFLLRDAHLLNVEKSSTAQKTLETLIRFAGEGEGESEGEGEGDRSSDCSNTTIILAGDRDGIERTLHARYPRLRSHFQEVFFEDYSRGELRQIFVDNVRTAGWELEGEEVADVASARVARGRNAPGFGNARSVRKVFELGYIRALARMQTVSMAPLNAVVIDTLEAEKPPRLLQLGPDHIDLGKQSRCIGEYELEPERTVNGCPCWRHTTNTHLHLAKCAGAGYWAVQKDDEVGGKSGGVYLASKTLQYPCSAEKKQPWRFHDGSEFTDAPKDFRCDVKTDSPAIGSGPIAYSPTSAFAFGAGAAAAPGAGGASVFGGGAPAAPAKEATDDQPSSAPMGEPTSRRLIITTADVLGSCPDPERDPELHAALADLDGLTGLAEVKRSVSALVKLARVNYERELSGGTPLLVPLNRLFLGNPGTGKTSVAAIYGRILKGLGYLSHGGLVLCTPSDLIGKYVGDTEANTSCYLERAAGKVLVIDEAYALHGSKFGAAALDTIVSKVHNRPGEDIAVILIGYEEPIRELLLKNNPGLLRRFPFADAFHFADFSDEELNTILATASRTCGLHVPWEVRRAVVRQLARERIKPSFGNAGAVDTMLGSAKQLLAAEGNAGATELSLRHFGLTKEQNGGGATLAAAERALAKLVKAEALHEHLLEVTATLAQLERDGKLIAAEPAKPIGNYIFCGAPGTGKTSAAQLLATFLQGQGVLASDALVTCSALDLQGSYLGQTKDKVTQLMNDAVGGILFIDEAYALGGDDKFCQQAVDQLTALMTTKQHLHRTVVILAGYRESMDAMLCSVNPGFRSRFSQQLDFPDWDAADCVECLQNKAREEGVALDQEALPTLRVGFERLQKCHGFANARDAVSLYTTCYKARAVRLRNAAAAREKGTAASRALQRCDAAWAIERMMNSRGEASHTKAKHEPRGSRVKAMNKPKGKEAKAAGLDLARDNMSQENAMPLRPKRLATI